MDTSNQRKGTTWSKRLVNALYKISRGMWEHRNNTLFKNRTDTVSHKRREMILEQVEDELQLGKGGLCQKDLNTICFDRDKLVSWTTPALEMWIKHVRKTRQCSAELGLKRRFDGPASEIDKTYQQRRQALRQSSNREFMAWRMKHHYDTLKMHLHSTKELQKELTDLLHTNF